MTKTLRAASYAVLALGAVLILSVPPILHDRLTRAEGELQAAQRGAKAALALSDSAVAVAKRAADSAAIYRAQRDSLNRRAQSLEARVAELRGSFHEAAAAAPDTCQHVVALASVTIDSLSQLAATQKARAEKAESADSLTHLALDSTQVALNSARLSLGELGKAADAVERASRPSLLSRILPKPGYGATAGIDAFGKPNAVVGFTLSWSF